MKQMFGVGLLVMAMASFALAEDGSDGNAQRAISLNTFAVSKKTSPQEISIVAVPWTSYFTNFTAGVSLTNLPVAKVVNSLNLTNGDQIVVYKDGREFYAWTLKVDDQGFPPQWVATDVYASDSVTSGSEHQDKIVDRGYSFWLKRKNAEKPFFVYGQYATNAEQVVVAPGESAMIGNIDTLHGLKLNGDLQYAGGSPYSCKPVEDGDRIWLSGNGPAARILYWNVSKGWYYVNGGKLVTDVVVSPGEGFWYVRSSNATENITVKIRPPDYNGQ